MEYIGQICQDDEVNKKFRELHHKLVNEVISFCKENNVSIDEFNLNADCVEPSIPYGQWEACTDSCLELYSERKDNKPYLISI